MIVRDDDRIPGECHRKAMLADLPDTDQWEVDLGKFMATAGIQRKVAQFQHIAGDRIHRPAVGSADG